MAGVLDELLSDGTFSYNEEENFRGGLQATPVNITPVFPVPSRSNVPTPTPERPMTVGNLPNVPVSKAQFDISIKRLRPIRTNGTTGASFNEDLQVILFAASQVKNHYKKMLNYSGTATYMGLDGGNITNPLVTLPAYPFNAHRFIYKTTDTGDPATEEYARIVISCPQVDYTTLLSALESDIIRINYIKYFVPSSTEAVQFNKRFEFNEVSLFGKRSNDGIPVLSNIRTYDYKDRLIELPVSLYIDKTKGILLDVAPELENKEIILSLFVDFTNRQTV